MKSWTDAKTGVSASRTEWILGEMLDGGPLYKFSVLKTIHIGVLIEEETKRGFATPSELNVARLDYPQQIIELSTDIFSLFPAQYPCHKTSVPHEKDSNK